MKTYLITGCTGAVGTALINELVNHGDSVFAVLNPESGRNDNIPDSPQIIKVFCGLDDYALLPQKVGEAYCAQCADTANKLKTDFDGSGCATTKEKTPSPEIDTFFHLAWRGASGPGRNDTVLQESNVKNALLAVKAAASLGCRLFIGAGSQAEYGRPGCKLTPDTPTNPETEYGKKKSDASFKTRQLAEKLGIDHIWVRILSVYGKNDGVNSLIPNAVRMLKNSERPHYTKGEQIWDYLYSGDAALALRLIAEKGVPFKTYVLGSGEAKPLKEYLKILHEAVNPDIAPIFGEVPYSDSQVMYLSADISDLTHDTGFKPQTDFRTGILNILKG